MLRVHELHRSGLHPVSFELDTGECLVVQGASGSGKTLLLRAIADLDPNQARVTLDGESREVFPAPLWRRRVAYLPATSGWWGEYVGEHFSDWERAIPLLETLYLSATVRDWAVQRLSTGERQRLALARALILQPRVLLLDEPTSGLDTAATTAVEQIVEKRQQDGVSVLWVTHDVLQARRLAKRCLLIESGCVRESTLS